MPSRTASKSPAPSTDKRHTTEKKKKSLQPRARSRSPSNKTKRKSSKPVAARKRSRSRSGNARRSKSVEKVKIEKDANRKKQKGSPSGETQVKKEKRDGRPERRREGEERQERTKKDKAKRELSPLQLGGRRWDDDSVKKEGDLGTWGSKDDQKEKDSKKIEKQKPNFAPSGALDEERTTINGISVKYCEPGDARPPDAKWRLYVFKGDKCLDPLALHRQSAYVVGRERKVAHLPIDHPSCSKQHSVIQFRIKRTASGSVDEEAITSIRPYIIDLNSTNGTILNGKKIDPAKYYELMEEDVLKFGHSTREYVLLKAEPLVGPATLDEK